MASIRMYKILRFGYKNEMWPKTFIPVHSLNFVSLVFFFAVFDERISAIVIVYLLLLKNIWME